MHNDKYSLKYLSGFNDEAYGLPIFKNLTFLKLYFYGCFLRSAYISFAFITNGPRTAY